MIKDRDFWQSWQRKRGKTEEVDFFKNVRTYEEMYRWARKLGAFPPQDILEGIEIDIKVARIINSV